VVLVKAAKRVIQPPGDLTRINFGTCDHFWSQNPFRRVRQNIFLLRMRRNRKVTENLKLADERNWKIFGYVFSLAGHFFHSDPIRLNVTEKLSVTPTFC
jgi:hypothetical protein